jgi:1,4-dihydroxy-2-naphthoate octaprenyltransferase
VDDDTAGVLTRYATALAGMARLDQLALVCVVYAMGVLLGLDGTAPAASVAGGGETGPVTAAGDGTPIGPTTPVPSTPEGNVLPGLAALLAVALPVHYANEYADYETDALTNRTEFSGGSGALHATGLDRAFAGFALVGAAVVAAVALLAAAVVGLPVTALALLVVILVAGVAYSLGPRLAWRGFGELTNALLGGLALPLYGVAVTGSPVNAVDLATFLPFTAVVFANLLATQWPDRRADAHVGKRTLAVSQDVRTLRGLYGTAATLGVGGLLVLAGVDLVPLALLAFATPTAVLLVLGARRYGRVESPAVTVYAMVALAFAYVLATACPW